jgi:hypothetical protein
MARQISRSASGGQRLVAALFLRIWVGVMEMWLVHQQTVFEKGGSLIRWAGLPGGLEPDLWFALFSGGYCQKSDSLIWKQSWKKWLVTL